MASYKFRIKYYYMDNKSSKTHEIRRKIRT